MFVLLFLTMNFLRNVSTFNNENIKRIILCLVVNGRVLTVNDNDDLVGLPAGNVEKFDNGTIFQTLKRIYKKETGNEMPNLINEKRFIYCDNTAIYYAETNDKIITTIGHGAEKRALHLTKFDDLRKALNYGRNSFALHSSVIAPLVILIGKYKLL